MNTDKATARPWHLESILDGEYNQTWQVCSEDMILFTLESYEDAELIIKAVNRDHAFDALLEAAMEFKTWYMTLSHMNPDESIKLRQILPNNVINKIEHAIKQVS